MQITEKAERRTLGSSRLGAEGKSIAQFAVDRHQIELRPSVVIIRKLLIFETGLMYCKPLQDSFMLAQGAKLVKLPMRLVSILHSSTVGIIIVALLL